MNELIRKLASLKLNVGLLLLIALVLAAGTIIESRSGTEAAQVVYQAPWFHALLGLFAVNLFCSLWKMWPWRTQRIGYALSHGSMLLILIGALTTQVYKIDGRLGLWEGEESNTILVAGSDGAMDPHLLPFFVRLDSFEIDYYPGTRRPAMFRSRVRVSHPAAGQDMSAVIEMNRELSYGGYRFFQSSYQQSEGREMTVLSVSRDPGQPIVFTGYVLLMLGMVTVLVTRMIQSRRVSAATLAAAVTPAPGSAARIAGVLLVGTLAGGGAVPVSAATLPDAEAVEAVRGLPVQHDGRVMPLDTLAREAVWNITGREAWQGSDPVALVLGWSLHPREWAVEPLIRVGSKELAAYAGLAGSHGSYQDLVGNNRLLELVRRARAEARAERPLSSLMDDALKLEGRLVWLQGFLVRESVRAVPGGEDPSAAWSAPDRLESAEDLVTLMRDQREAGLSGYPTEGTMAREVRYNRLQPSRLAWWILLPATIFSLLAWRRPRLWLDVLSVGGLLAGFGMMTWGLATRWGVAGRIPASNMYESLLFLGWGVALFALVAAVFLRNRLVIFNATAMSALTMLLVDRLPIDPFVHPMPPVLSGTPWLAIHVPIIMVSYSVFALGVLIAHMQVGIEIFAPARRPLIARMNELLYWYMHVGSILLMAGILTGSIWAASSWGRYWGWDPKEVWSLIAFLAYMAILHGRIDRFFGPFVVAAASIVAFWAILMTYIGVNYVLTAGLHSYGFGGSRVVSWMMMLIVLEAFFLWVGLMAHAKNRRATLAETPG